jgi:hypothetical protein
MIPKEQRFIILVCGGRNYSDYRTVKSTLDSYISSLHRLQDHKIDVAILTGGARGADSLAKQYALNNNLIYIEMPANWDKLAKGAGPLRNQSMLDFVDVNFVIAFPGGTGTADMVKRAQDAKIGTLIVEELKNEVPNN